MLARRQDVFFAPLIGPVFDDNLAPEHPQLEQLLSFDGSQFPRLFVMDNHRRKQAEYPYPIDRDKTTGRAIYAWAMNFVTAAEIAAKEAELAAETKADKKHELTKTLKKLKQTIATYRADFQEQVVHVEEEL